MRLAAVAIPLALLAACAGADPAPPVAAVAWREVTLPADGAAVRDTAFCGDRWYTVGGLAAKPAAWSSRDAATWTQVRLRPVSFYGAQSTLFTVACRGADAVAVGAASGGAHGNPRTSTWRSQPDGSWLEYEPEFEQFGGQDSVGVGAVATGSEPPGRVPGWAIVGNWLGPDDSPGPAVWHSTDGATFTRALVSPSTGGSSARATDIAALPTGRWLVVGEAYGSTATGASWVSPDGAAWTASPVSGRLALVTPYPDGALAVGADGAWWYDGSGWHRRGKLDGPPASAAGSALRFLSLSASPATGGSTPVGSGTAPSGSGTAPAGGRTASAEATGTGAGETSLGLVAAATGSVCRLWSTRDGGATWREIAMPAALAVTAQTTAALAVGHGGTVLLATDDGTRARLWLTTM